MGSASHREGRKGRRTQESPTDTTEAQTQATWLRNLPFTTVSSVSLQAICVVFFLEFFPFYLGSKISLP